MNTYICRKSAETFKGIINTKFRIVLSLERGGVKVTLEVS